MIIAKISINTKSRPILCWWRLPPPLCVTHHMRDILLYIFTPCIWAQTYISLCHQHCRSLHSLREAENRKKPKGPTPHTTRNPPPSKKQAHGHQPCPILDNYTYINLLWSECQVIERPFVWKVDNRHDALGFGLVSFPVSVRVNTALLRYQPLLQYKYAINGSAIWIPTAIVWPCTDSYQRLTF